jgi:hypothetical protein
MPFGTFGVSLTLGSRNDRGDICSGVMQNPSEYRKYADECDRIAELSNTKNKEALIEIARAWRMLADEAERRDGAKSKGRVNRQDNGPIDKNR